MDNTPVEQWLHGEYGRIYLRAAVLVWLRRQAYTPLAASVFTHTQYPSNVKRRTEDFAMATAQGRDFSLPDAPSAGQHMRLLLDGNEGQGLRPANMEFVGLICPKCGERKPRTADHWHRDATAADGLRTDRCKACRRVDVARRMRHNRKDTQVKSQYTRATS